MSDHWDKCLKAAKAHAADLQQAVAARRLNASTVEGLMRSYLDQPAFYPEWREPLLREALGSDLIDTLQRRAAEMAANGTPPVVCIAGPDGLAKLRLASLKRSCVSIDALTPGEPRTVLGLPILVAHDHGTAIVLLDERGYDTYRRTLQPTERSERGQPT